MKKIIVNVLPFVFCLSLSAQSNGIQVVEVNLLNVVKNTLVLNPSIQRQLLAVKRSKAELQSSQSVFDMQLTSELSYFRAGNHLLDLDPRNQFLNQIQNRNGQFRVGLQKTFRNSLGVQTTADWARKSDNIPFDEFQQMESPYLARNTGNLGVNFIQPLLKGRGRNVATANEQASMKLVEAQERNLVQTAAQEVLAAITIYWQYVGAYQIFKINQGNEARVQRLLEMTQTLIEADKKPRAELVQIRADLAQKQGQTILAKQSFLRIQQLLKSRIGFEEQVTLGMPNDIFPSPNAANFSIELQASEFYEMALKNRPDLKSVFLNQAALSNFLDLSENGLKPQLDLKGSLGYGGFRKGGAYGNLLSLFGEEAGSRWNAGITLSYLFPLQNNRAKAQWMLQKIALQDQKVLLDNETRNIKINLNIAVNNLQQTYAALQKSEETFNLFLIAFANEQEKFQNGLTTLINVILFQERLTLAETRYIQFQQQFAIDLATLRFETGLLMKADYFQADSLKERDFYQIPKG